MKEYGALIIVCLCATLLIGGAQIIPLEFLPPVDSANILETVPLRGSFPLIHFTFNWFISWRFDPLIELLSQSLGGGRHVGPFLLSLVFMVGGSLAGILVHPKGPGRCVLLSLLVTAALFQYFGSDTVLWGSIAWVPLLAAIGHVIRQRPSVPALALFLCVGVLTLLSAHGAASAAVSAALVLAMGISKYATPSSPASRLETLLFSALLVGAIIVGAMTPLPSTPSYPSYARVVEDDHIPGNAIPLIGPHLPIPTVDRVALKPISSALGLILLGALLLTFHRESVEPEGRDPLALLALTSSVLLFLDGHFIPDPWSHIFPLQSISRMIPGLFITPVHFLLFGVGLIAVLIRMAYRPRRILDLAIVVLVLGAPIVASPNIKGIYGWVTERGNEAILLSALNKNQQLSPLLSPSYRMFRLFPNLEQPQLKPRVHPAPKLLQAATLTASSQQETVELMRDDSLETRWSSGTGSQSGREWFAIFWVSPKELAGLELMSGPYTGDFPRGLKVSSAKNCEVGKPVAIETLADFPEWQGTIRFTKEKVPFFDGQEKVFVKFPEQREIGCLLIQQTGTTRDRDWSVAEVRLFK